MPTIRELITKFSFQVDNSPLSAMRTSLASVGQDFKKNFDTTPLKNSEATLNRVIDKAVGVKESFNGIAAIGMGIATAVTAMAAGLGTAFAGVKQTADYADRIKDTSDQLGIATDDLQSLGYVAQLSGSSMDELAVSLRFLSRNAVDAAENAKGPAAEGFRKLGISVKDAQGNFKSSTVLLEEMAQGFARMPEGPERTALAMDLLGKSGASMVPLLSQGSEAVAALKQEAFDLGLVLSGDALDAGGKFNDEMDRLTAVGNGLKFSIGGALLPLFTEWVTKFRGIIVANKEIITQRLEVAVRIIGEAFSVVWNIISKGYDIVTRIADMFGGLEKVAMAVGIALLGMGSLAVLSAIGSIAIACGGLVAALIAVDIAAIKTAISVATAWIAAAAIPILIGAAIVAVALLFEDLWTYFQGGESAFGKWVKMFDEFVDSVINMGKAIGSMLYDNIVQPFIDGYDFISGIAKEILGIDVSAPVKRGSALAGGPGSPALAGPMAPKFFDTGIGSAYNAPSIPPSAAVVSPLNQSSNMNVQNSYTINANGLDEDQARRVVGEEVAKSQTDLFKRAGQNSTRKNRE